MARKRSPAAKIEETGGGWVVGEKAYDPLMTPFPVP
jgi:hypothetical protein